MASEPGGQRQLLRRLAEEMPESELSTAVRVMEALRATGDPVLRALLEAPEDESRVAAARQNLREGRGVSHEEARRRLLNGS